MGSISTILSGTGKAKLDFGNCGITSGGTVKAILDGEEIASAGPEAPNNIVEFNFNDGSSLSIKETNWAVIQFNSLEILSYDENCV